MKVVETKVGKPVISFAAVCSSPKVQLKYLEAPINSIVFVRFTFILLHSLLFSCHLTPGCMCEVLLDALTPCEIPPQWLRLRSSQLLSYCIFPFSQFPMNMK